ncbi:pyocin knob domain-containing protein [Paenibacillus amylolyticus]|uniref:tail fiber protein n=1 Tax=Paenibacillus amylolyticus TaxID=1451 RepID=UPI003D2D0806
MPQETDRLKLPLPLGNENVTRESINGIFEKIDAGVASQADLDVLREAVSQMDIPDASLTQKGKVQLSSKTDGTSEAVAATEKAVRDARVAAQDTTKAYVDAKTWQKFKLTADDGSSQRLSDGADLDFVTANGQYNGVNLGNAPTPQSVNEWWYIEVQRHSINTNYVLQRASRLNGTSYQPTLYQRIKLNGIWGAWSPDVFQSGVDAKNGIVGAINANGGSASTSDSWATLASKVQTVGPRYASGVAASTASNQRILFNLERGGTYSTSYFTVSGLSFRPNRIIVKIPLYTQQPFLYSTTSRNGANGYNLFGSINNTQAQTDQYRVYEQTGQTTIQLAYVNDTGFLLPAMDMNLTQVEWEAFRV